MSLHKASILFVAILLMSCSDAPESSEEKREHISGSQIDSSHTQHKLDTNFNYLQSKVVGDTVIQILVHPDKSGYLHKLKYNKDNKEVYENEGDYLVPMTKRVSKYEFKFVTYSTYFPNMEKTMSLYGAYKDGKELNKVHLKDYKLPPNKAVNTLTYTFNDSIFNLCDEYVISVFYYDSLAQPKKFTDDFSYLGNIEAFKIIE